MKFKSLILGCCLSLSSLVFAANQHLHPQANQADSQSANKTLSWPGFCEIEIINNSYEDVRVNGVFDDGAPLIPFNIYSFEAPHYISLFYYGYCHAGMNLYIETFSGYPVWSGYIANRQIIRIYPYFGKQVKAEMKTK